MAVQIYQKDFGASRNTSYYAYERDEDVRETALRKVNEFFFKHDNVDIVNIVESWNESMDFLRLVVYYKGYI